MSSFDAEPLVFAEDENPPKRRTRIRVWCVGVLCLFALATVIWLPPRELRRLAVLEVRRLGGHAHYDQRFRRHESNEFRDYLPLAYTGPVRFVSFRRAKLPPGGLACLRHLPELRNLDLTSAEFPVHDLSVLRHLEQLNSLCLADLPVDDRALPTIAKMPNLKVLVLNYTKVTDQGIDDIAAAPNLRLVRLESTPVTNDGLKRLRALRPELRIVANTEEFPREPIRTPEGHLIPTSTRP